MNVLDLFAGVGGFALGLERAGMHVVALCESDAYCRRVLTKRWLRVRCYRDVRDITADRLRSDGIPVDLVCGGFPCQDISRAGRGAGLDGERSGLWFEFARIICDVRPRYAIVENTSTLLVRGMDRILADLAAIGFHAEWRCLRACDFGAPHIRERVFIVAYSNADASGLSLSEQETVFGTRRRPEGRAIAELAQWAREPGMGRVAYGIPDRVDRLRALGNAVVPQIAEHIGRAVLDHARARA